MELTPEQYDQIQKFADGDMTPEEEDAFLLEVSGNSEMQEYLNLELTIRDNPELLLNRGSEDLGQKVTNPFDDPVYIRSLIRAAEPGSMQKTAPVISVRFLQSIAVAATLLVAISLLITRFSNYSSHHLADKKKDPLPQTRDSADSRQIDTLKSIETQPASNIDYAGLFKAYYKKDDPPGEVPQLLADAMIDYEAGDYRKLKQFDLYDLPVTRGEPDEGQASKQVVREFGHYYKGIAYLETRNEAQAITNLKWVADNARNNTLRGKAQYYLALTYVKSGNIKDASMLLEKVSVNKQLRPYNADARKLLSSLQ